MKIGVLTVLLSGLERDKALDYLKSVGVDAVEIGCGGYPGDAHCDAPALLADRVKNVTVFLHVLNVHAGTQI